MIGIGFWGILYYSSNEEALKPYSFIKAPTVGKAFVGSKVSNPGKPLCPAGLEFGALGV